MSCIFNYILSSPSGYRPRCTICHPNEKKLTLIACCLFILTIWTRVTDSSVLITTTRAWKTKVSSYYFSTDFKKSSNNNAVLLRELRYFIETRIHKLKNFAQTLVSCNLHVMHMISMWTWQTSQTKAASPFK